MFVSRKPGQRAQMSNFDYKIFLRKKKAPGVPLPAGRCQTGQFCGCAQEGRSDLRRSAVPGSPVPSFVPTTKPYRVLLSVAISMESLAGQGICSIRSQLVALSLSCHLGPAARETT
jgi:hypothetical protein